MPSGWESNIEAQMRYKSSVWQLMRDLETLPLGLSDFPSAGRKRDIFVKDPTIRYGTLLFPQKIGIKSKTGYALFCLCGDIWGEGYFERPSGLAGRDTKNWVLAERVVSHDRIRWVVHGCKAYRSLGENVISRLQFKMGLEVIISSMMKIFRSCILVGYITISTSGYLHT
jgi:hypothetical protein